MFKNEWWQGSSTDSERALGNMGEKQGLVRLYYMLKICFILTRDPEGMSKHQIKGQRGLFFPNNFASRVNSPQRKNKANQ